MNPSPSKSWFSVAGAVLIAAVLSACGDSGPARLDSVKLGKDENLSTETAAFAPTDTIYSKAKVAGSPDKVSIKWQLFLDKVEGQPENSHNNGTDVSIDLSNGQNLSTYHLTAPPSGWPKGTYHIDVRMLVGGEQKEQKNVPFTIN